MCLFKIYLQQMICHVLTIKLKLMQVPLWDNVPSAVFKVSEKWQSLTFRLMYFLVHFQIALLHYRLSIFNTS